MGRGADFPSIVRVTATYLGSIHTGLLLFLALGAVSLLPLAAVHYRRYGRIEPKRMLVSYAFLAYAAVAVALVFLPLPDPARVCATVQDTTQLMPFQWFVDMQAELAKHGRSGFLAGLTSKSVLSFAFNIALFAPLGVFLRRAFGKGLGATAVTGFGVSLFVELTQLTGNWGTFPCAYRLFDVDDLIGNTGGTMIGFALAPLVVLVPRLAPVAPVLPEVAGVPRRVAALAVDLLLPAMFFFSTGGNLLGVLGPVLLTRVFIPWFGHGWTPGGWLLGYRAHQEDSSWGGLFRLAGRELMALPGLVCFVLIAPVLAGGWSTDAQVLIALALGAVLVLLLAFRPAAEPIRHEMIDNPDDVRRLTPTG